MREFFVIEGSMGAIIDILGKYQGSQTEFKVEGFSSRRIDFEITYSVLVSWLRIV